MSNSQFPAGWDEARVRRVIDHHESQTEEEAAEEDEAALEPAHTVVEIPADLLPAVRELLARRRAG